MLLAGVTKFPALRSPTGEYDIDAETVASRTIRAAFAFESEDLEATRERREQAAAAVPATYSMDLERVKTQKLTLQQRINTLRERRAEVEKAVREALLASTSAESDDEVVKRVAVELATAWKQDPLFEGFPEPNLLAQWILPSRSSIPKREFTPGEAGGPLTVKGLIGPEGQNFEFRHAERLTTLALDGLEYVLMAGVIQPGAGSTLEGQRATKIKIIRGQVVGDLKPGEEVLLSEAPTPNTARTRLRSYIAERARALEAREADKTIDWDAVQNAAFEMAASLVTDTLYFDQVDTEANRALARAAVEPVMKAVEANQIIQQEGYRWTQQSRSDVKTYWSKMAGSQPTRRLVMPVVANAVLVALFLAALLRATPLFSVQPLPVRQGNGPDRAEEYKSINVALLIMCGTVALGRVIYYFEPSGLLVPVTASAILLAILTNTRLAFFASLLTAGLLSVQYGYSWQLLVVGGVMSFAGVASLYVVRKRNDMTRAAVQATLVGLLAVGASSLALDTLATWKTAQMFVMVALNGLACVFIVPGLLSPLERLFRITTDIQLLEYSDLNNELLRRLAIEVPATYAHSLMLGQLAEAAADAIGANGLLARVCAYYHDIGKLRRPEYFSENQIGYNIHEDLSPRLSARAIASHVAEGVELAKEYHLPKPIIDGILEHHGTLLISYFYQQAQDQQKHGDVREEDFRYPGPKPQSRETAILMICDGVESGVRTIKNPNEERVREFIDKIIQDRSVDRQFDECDLTLRDLDTIGDALATRIMSTMHTRIAYPEKTAPREVKNVIPIPGGRE